jgi:hypothetical protein
MVDTILEALDLFREHLERRLGDKVINVLSLNLGRHYLVTTESGMRYYLMFKRDFFHSFGVIFNKAGIGESINKEYLEMALQHDADNIAVVYLKGYIYVCPPKEWLHYSKTQNTIRQQKVGGETTYSIPITLLRRWL